MVVGRQNESAAQRKSVALGDELDGCCRVGGEADIVDVRIGIEEGERRGTGGRLCGSASAGRQMLRVGIAENPVRQPVTMRSCLRGAVQRARRVIEIGDAGGIETREFAGAKSGKVECIGRIDGLHGTR